MKISTAKYGSYVPTFQQKQNTSTKYIIINIMYFIILLEPYISVGTCWNHFFLNLFSVGTKKWFQRDFCRSKESLVC